MLSTTIITPAILKVLYSLLVLGSFSVSPYTYHQCLEVCVCGQIENTLCLERVQKNKERDNGKGAEKKNKE